MIVPVVDEPTTEEVSGVGEPASEEIVEEDGQNVAAPATTEEETPVAPAEEELITEITTPGETTEEEQIPEAAPDAPEVEEQITEAAPEEDQQTAEPAQEEATNAEIAPDAPETEEDQEVPEAAEEAESVPEKDAVDDAAPSPAEVVDNTEESEHPSAEDITTQVETMEMAKVRATRKRVKVTKSKFKIVNRIFLRFIKLKEKYHYHFECTTFSSRPVELLRTRGRLEQSDQESNIVKV